MKVSLMMLLKSIADDVTQSIVDDVDDDRKVKVSLTMMSLIEKD